MGTVDLSSIGSGFEHPPLASQSVFRDALDSLSQPGSVIPISAAVKAPAGVDTAACALLLALLDQDTRLWLSPGIAGGGAAGFFRFHTGCVPTVKLEQADFALIATPGERPPLDQFLSGSEDFPDRSATLVLQVPLLEAGSGWTLSGPGIPATRCLRVGGIDNLFVIEWTHNRRGFPRGVDVFLTCGTRVAGLPRTTRLEA